MCFLKCKPKRNDRALNVYKSSAEPLTLGIVNTLHKRMPYVIRPGIRLYEYETF